ncbi:hypothetical protein HDV64DRAFT_243175 [Trichoderma sp. TUCIM 5745]
MDYYSSLINYLFNSPRQLGRPSVAFLALMLLAPLYSFFKFINFSPVISLLLRVVELSSYCHFFAISLSHYYLVYWKRNSVAFLFDIRVLCVVTGLVD